MQAIFTILASLIVAVSAAPVPPDASAIAKIIGIKPERVSRSPEKKTAKTFTWSVRYLIDGNSGYSLSLILVPSGQIKADRIQMIRDSPNLEYKRVETKAGDVIHQSLVDQGDLGTSYISMLITKERDWDLMVGLERKPEAKKEAPFLISKDGIRFAEAVETLLRSQKHQSKE